MLFYEARMLLCREEQTVSSEIFGEDVSEIFPTLISFSNAGFSNPFWLYINLEMDFFIYFDTFIQLAEGPAWQNSCATCAIQEYSEINAICHQIWNLEVEKFFNIYITFWDWIMNWKIKIDHLSCDTRLTLAGWMMAFSFIFLLFYFKNILSQNQMASNMPRICPNIQKYFRILEVSKAGLQNLRHSC